MVRCDKCETEAVLRSRFNRHEFTGIEDAERRVLEVILRPVSAQCSSCKETGLSGMGSRHVFLMYSERASAHLAITLRMTREEDERIKVLRQVWVVPTDATALEVEHEDERLEDFWADSQIRRRAVNPDPRAGAMELEELATEMPNDALLLRELGNCLIDAGNTARALAAYELSLEGDREQPSTLSKAGRLYTSLGMPGRGSELLLEAWDQTKKPDLLLDVLRAAYRGRRFGALERAAQELLVHEPGNVQATKARALCAAYDNVGDLRDRWEDLQEAAAAAGDRETLHTARFWCSIFELPMPDWTPSMRASDWIEAFADELEPLHHMVERDPSPLDWGEAEIPVDLEVVTEEGEHLLFLLIEEVSNAALRQTIATAVRAALDDERRPICRVVPVWRQPLSYGTLNFASNAPTAETLLLADADTTMSVIDENVSAFVLSAETHFGRSLDFTFQSIEEVDAILLRLHDGGFGEVTYAFQCQAAAYVGEVIRNVLEDATWIAADAPMDPRVFQIAEDEELNLISKVGKLVRNGAEDSLSHFISSVLSQSG